MLEQQGHNLRLNQILSSSLWLHTNVDFTQWEFETKTANCPSTFDLKESVYHYFKGTPSIEGKDI